MKPVAQNMVPGMDLAKHYSKKSDISCTMDRLIYDENPISPIEESPSKSLDTLDDESQTNDLEEAMGFDKKTMEIPTSNEHIELMLHVIIVYHFNRSFCTKIIEVRFSTFT